MMEETILETTAETVAETTAPAIVSEAENVIEAVSTGNVDSSVLKDFTDALIAYIPTVVTAVIIFIVGKILAKILVRIIDKGMGRSHIDETAQGFMRSLLSIIFTAFVIVIALSTLGIPMTSIVTAIGAAGVAVALALQNSLSNVAGGIMLLINKPFKIGDYIMVSGVSGTVKQITILYTRLDSDSNQAIFIPNGQVSGAVVTNNNTNGTRRVDMKFSISYEDDYQKAREVILQVLSRNEKILRDPAPTVRMLEHAASSINIVVRPWCAAADYWEVYFSVTEEIRAEFITAGISIPFDQLDVHVVKE